MALPKFDVPIYDVVLPISKQAVRYRPFLVKEQKLLLMANESVEVDVIEKTVKQVLQNCSVDDIDVDNLSLIDIEFYFLHLRAKSVGEKVETKYKCENDVNGVECGNLMDVSLDLEKITVDNLDGYEDIIKLTDSVGVKMTLPKYTAVSHIKQSESMTESLFTMITECIEYVYDGEQIHYSKEISKSELIEFLESLSEEQFGKIQNFFNTIPKIEKNLYSTCKKCGFEHVISLQGIESFFV
jgi:hypothetical protein